MEKKNGSMNNNFVSDSRKGSPSNFSSFTGAIENIMKLYEEQRNGA